MTSNNNAYHSRPFSRRAFVLGSTAAAVGLIATACGSDAKKSSTTAPTASSSAGSTAPSSATTESSSSATSVAPDTSVAGSADAGKLTRVTLALDYIPSPSHDGLAVADAQGYFAEQGIKLEILPYGATASDALVASGQADFGIVFGATYGVTAFAAGLPVTSVFVIYQHNPSALGVLESSKFTRPADLAGHTYGGFGSPVEIASVNEMIKKDGGTGTADQVVLSIGAYDAVGNGDVDCAFFYADDIYNAEKNGHPIRSFDSAEYGLPDNYGQLVLVSNDYLKNNADLVKGFVAALQKGYQFAVDTPADAEKILLDYFPDQLDAGLVAAVSAVQTKRLYVNGDGGPVGGQTVERWQATADFLFGLGLLVDANGDKLKSSLDVTPFINDTFVTGS